jgi:putative phosphoribosyl transferase
LLLDLLTEREAEDRRNVFNVGFLAGRLRLATEWLSKRKETDGARIGYFGSSTGAAAALVAAAGADVPIEAIVSRGGRPDLAAEALERVTAPTLLIGGGADRDVLALNRQALAAMRCEKKLEIVPDAGHLFEEPGALDQVVSLARDWFVAHLKKEASHAPRSLP